MTPANENDNEARLALLREGARARWRHLIRPKTATASLPGEAAANATPAEPARNEQEQHVG